MLKCCLFGNMKCDLKLISSNSVNVCFEFLLKLLMVGEAIAPSSFLNHLGSVWISNQPVFLLYATFLKNKYSVYVCLLNCHFYNFTIKGLRHSSILQNNDNYLGTLSNWLKPVVQSKSSCWTSCWHASVDGWAASTFHSRCDNKGPTVTIMKVGQYIFGGYASISWSK